MIGWFVLLPTLKQMFFMFQIKRRINQLVNDKDENREIGKVEKMGPNAFILFSGGRQSNKFINGRLLPKLPKILIYINYKTFDYNMYILNLI